MWLDNCWLALRHWSVHEPVVVGLCVCVYVCVYECRLAREHIIPFQIYILYASSYVKNIFSSHSSQGILASSPGHTAEGVAWG